MSTSAFIDFHRSWMIEIFELESGFSAICCSPAGERVNTRHIHLDESAAYEAAMHHIDWLCAAQALKQVVRAAYEQDRLAFEEWQSLQRSLS